MLDSLQQVLTYLMSLSHGMNDEKIAAAYIDKGHEMVRFLEGNTPVHFYCIAEFPESHSKATGCMPEGGRALECPLFSYGELCTWRDRVGTLPYVTLQ